LSAAARAISAIAALRSDGTVKRAASMAVARLGVGMDRTVVVGPKDCQAWQDMQGRQARDLWVCVGSERKVNVQ